MDYDKMSVDEINTLFKIISNNNSVKYSEFAQTAAKNFSNAFRPDQQKIAAETMAIWKEAKVNPFGSCLPILLQFPFLIALFYVIQSGINPDNTYLLYSQYGDLSLQNININFSINNSNNICPRA